MSKEITFRNPSCCSAVMAASQKGSRSESPSKMKSVFLIVYACITVARIKVIRTYSVYCKVLYVLISLVWDSVRITEDILPH
jgi:hypothetical protein